MRLCVLTLNMTIKHEQTKDSTSPFEKNAEKKSNVTRYEAMERKRLPKQPQQAKSTHTTHIQNKNLNVKNEEIEVKCQLPAVHTLTLRTTHISYYIISQLGTHSIFPVCIQLTRARAMHVADAGAPSYLIDILQNRRRNRNSSGICEVVAIVVVRILFRTEATIVRLLFVVRDTFSLMNDDHEWHRQLSTQLSFEDENKNVWTIAENDHVLWSIDRFNRPWTVTRQHQPKNYNINNNSHFWKQTLNLCICVNCYYFFFVYVRVQYVREWVSEWVGGCACD